MPLDERREKDRVADYSVWKIAGGILVAMMVWSVYERWQTNMAIKAYNAEVARVFNLAEIEHRSREWFPQVAASRERSQRAEMQRQEQKSRAAEAAALQPGERCISGQRFRRIDNGWEQSGSC